MTITTGLSYRDKDIEALRGHEKDSTSGAVNEIAARAGATQTHTIRGDDKTEREIHAEHKDHEGGIHAVAEGAGEGAQFGVEHLIEHTHIVYEPVMLPLSLVKFGLDAMKHVGEDDIVGHERAQAYSKDAMHAFMVGNLAGLPNISACTTANDPRRSPPTPSQTCAESGVARVCT